MKYLKTFENDIWLIPSKYSVEINKIESYGFNVPVLFEFLKLAMDMSMYEIYEWETNLPLSFSNDQMVKFDIMFKGYDSEKRKWQNISILFSPANLEYILFHVFVEQQLPVKLFDYLYEKGVVEKCTEIQDKKGNDKMGYWIKKDKLPTNLEPFKDFFSNKAGSRFDL